MYNFFGVYLCAALDPVFSSELLVLFYSCKAGYLRGLSNIVSNESTGLFRAFTHCPDLRILTIGFICEFFSMQRVQT